MLTSLAVWLAVGSVALGAPSGVQKRSSGKVRPANEIIENVLIIAGWDQLAHSRAVCYSCRALLRLRLRGSCLYELLLTRPSLQNLDYDVARSQLTLAQTLTWWWDWNKNYGSQLFTQGVPSLSAEFVPM
jgi:hypothetical protein